MGLSDSKGRKVAEKVFSCELKVNGLPRPRRGNAAVNNEKVVKLEPSTDSTPAFPTTSWKVSLQKDQHFVSLRCQLDQEDAVWTKMPFSHRLAGSINALILKKDGSPWPEARNPCCTDSFDGCLERFDSEQLKLKLFERNNRRACTALLRANGSVGIIITICLYEVDRFPTPKFKESVCSEQLSLLEEEKAVDVKIVAKDGVKIKCHRFVLIARSRVFKAMLTGDTVEAKTGVIQMEDVSSTAVQSLLRHLYGGEVPKFVVNNDHHPEYPCISQIVYMADKYMLHDLLSYFNTSLLKFCEEEHPENAIFLMRLAKLYSLSRAQAEVKEFIISHKTVLSHAIDALESSSDSVKISI